MMTGRLAVAALGMLVASVTIMLVMLGGDPGAGELLPFAGGALASLVVLVLYIRSLGTGGGPWGGVIVLVSLAMLGAPSSGCDVEPGALADPGACASAGLLGCQMGWLDEIVYKPEAPQYEGSIPRLWHKVYYHVVDTNGEMRVVLGQLVSTAHLTSDLATRSDPQPRVAWFAPGWGGGNASPVLLCAQPAAWCASYEPWKPKDQLAPEDFLQPGELTMSAPASLEAYEAQVGPVQVW